MFDLDKIAETIRAGDGAADAGLADLVQHLADLGIDPSMLHGLAPQEIADQLAQYGIAIADTDAARLSEVAGRFGASDVLAGAGQWLSNRLLRL